MIRWNGTYQTIQRQASGYMFVAIPAMDAMIEDGPFLRIDCRNLEPLAVIMYDGREMFLEEHDLPQWVTWA